MIHTVDDIRSTSLAQRAQRITVKARPRASLDVLVAGRFLSSRSASGTPAEEDIMATAWRDNIIG
jgi:hypothetical protein